MTDDEKKTLESIKSDLENMKYVSQQVSEPFRATLISVIFIASQKVRYLLGEKDDGS